MYSWKEQAITLGFNIHYKNTSIGIGVKPQKDNPTVIAEFAQTIEFYRFKTAVTLEAGFSKSKSNIGIDLNLPLLDLITVQLNPLVGYYWSKVDSYPRLGLRISW